MKANQIRIGNYVRDPYNKEIKVAHVSPDDASFLNPIPLTEDWVLKLGFELKSKWTECGTYGLSLETDNGKYFAEQSGEILYAKELKYVHQIQNLYFAITGEELKIIDNG